MADEMTAAEYAQGRVNKIRAEIAQLQGQLVEAENFVRALTPQAETQEPNRATRRSNK